MHLCSLKRSTTQSRYLKLLSSLPSGETRPKLVICTAPSKGAREILKDLNGSYFLNKHGNVESRTSNALQDLVEAHPPSAWYFGHFHLNREFLIGETKFRCLTEMAISKYPKPSQRQKEFDEERAGHKKPSRLLRPALLVWFEVRVTRSVCPEVRVNQ
jgi:hypothetical protein